MIRRHVVESGLIALCVILTAIVLMMWWASQYAHFITTAMMIMIILGLMVGSLVPNIILTWLAISLTTIGSAILLLGYVVMDNSIKIMLLFAFPITASLAYFSRYIIGEWGWLDRNRAEIESYATHYNQIVKLQTAYNANKIYKKELQFIIKEQIADLWIDVTAIHWVHNHQIRQFHHNDYNYALQKIAKVLKRRRLPSEALYYLEDGTFLILSYHLPDIIFAYQNQSTRAGLDELQINSSKLQFKWGHLKVDDINATSFKNLESVMRHIERDMETDLVVEYLRGVQR
ncbi:efflux RND transporter permease subunit [Limosilactobacillus reuteri]|uniref:efflux RND transporter permease subunit n=1 Tax=Limosilactobacillus reuteri TaxID=1598 RepID=UPI0015DF3A90|nr:efflux RND transporter permease subunit [Limosilactobacillus reuteri]MCC4500392.1 hypothetical protein [Limosilactobacillus reuteri]MCC4504638.1 hypothetical protein [Limosilactobacillus reuteri]MCC4507018.1 hypothetical protein [Limosilactobacillus reuteri]QLL76686.1 hypothetical protein GTO86_09140 [Limosilactobacillus reuteri]